MAAIFEWQIDTLISVTVAGYLFVSLYFELQPLPDVGWLTASRWISLCWCKWAATRFPPQPVPPCGGAFLHVWSCIRTCPSQNTVNKVPAGHQPPSRTSIGRDEGGGGRRHWFLFFSRVEICWICFDWIQSHSDSTVALGQSLASAIYGCFFHAGCVSTRQRAWFWEETARRQQ